MNRLEYLKDNILKNKILIENFTFLSALQVSNLILFLITVPYLFRVLGSQNYGLIVFAQTIAFYFTIFINFGFNLTATRDISVNRDKKQKVTEIISSVLLIKLLLFLISFAVMLVMILLVDELASHRMLFIFSMIACLSEALFPIWYFQGIEKMKYITFINVTARVLATAAVFIVINNAEEYYYYPLIMGAGTFAGALAALVVVFNSHDNRFAFQPIRVIRGYISENVLYFLSSVSTQVYVNANKVIAGLFLGMTDVAYYDVAEKIVNMLKVPYSLLGQTLFPKVAREKRTAFLKRIMAFTLFFTVILIISVFGMSEYLVGFFSGTANNESVVILKILVLSVLPISFGMFYGDMILINFGLRKEYVRIRVAGLAFYMLLFITGYMLNIINLIYLALIIVAVEFLMASYSFLVVRGNWISELKKEFTVN
jgi:PST family polysaccharide transporter